VIELPALTNTVALLVHTVWPDLPGGAKAK